MPRIDTCKCWSEGKTWRYHLITVCGALHGSFSMISILTPSQTPLSTLDAIPCAHFTHDGPTVPLAISSWPCTLVAKVMLMVQNSAASRLDFFLYASASSDANRRIASSNLSIVRFAPFLARATTPPSRSTTLSSLAHPELSCLSISSST